MPFQGNPNAGAANPAIIQLLFAERERRARQQQEAEQAQFERMLRLQEAEQKRQQFELDMQNKRADLFGKIGNLTGAVSQAQRAEGEAKSRFFTMDDLTIGRDGQNLGPEFGAIVSGLDPSAPAQVQFTNQAEANRRNQENTLASYMQGAAGIGPQDALSAVRGQSSAQEFEEQRLSDLNLSREIGKENRAESRQIRKERREQQYAIASEERKRQAAEKLALGEELEFSDLREISKTDTKRLEFAQDVTRDYGLVDRLDMNNATDVLEMMQRWQKRVDEGAVVRDSDIKLMESVGASAIDRAYASVKKFFDENGSFPPGFGEQLRESFRGMLAEEDQKISDLYAGMEDYVDGLGLTESQKRAALPGNRRQAIKARERIAAREANEVQRTREASTVGPRSVTLSRSEFNKAARLLASLKNVTVDQLSAEEIDQFARATNRPVGQ